MREGPHRRWVRGRASSLTRRERERSVASETERVVSRTTIRRGGKYWYRWPEGVVKERWDEEDLEGKDQE